MEWRPLVGRCGPLLGGGLGLRGLQQQGEQTEAEARAVLEAQESSGLPLTQFAWMEVHSRLPSVTARLFFAGVVSLVPGSLVAKVEGERLFLHMLDATLAGRAAGLRGLRALESEVAFLFGLRLPWGRP